ncbi:hypothetical protein ABW19_dt0208397 [Dactylella cylindrospora]|nr:hypothetical protein ABW19_dt0208397 [Dactylella cylindrospora]
MKMRDNGEKTREMFPKRRCTRQERKERQTDRRWERKEKEMAEREGGSCREKYSTNAIELLESEKLFSSSASFFLFLLGFSLRDSSSSVGVVWKVYSCRSCNGLD